MKPSTRRAIARRTCAVLPPLVAQRVRHFLYPLEIGRAEDREVVVRSVTGSRFVGRTGDFHSYRSAIHGYFDWRNLAAALVLAGEGATIVEVGANVGTETIGYSDIVGSAGCVIAIEPVPANVVALEHNLRLRRFDNIEFVRVAVGARGGRTRFEAPVSQHHSGLGHVLGPSEVAGDYSLEVEVASLDSICGDMAEVDLIVIDAEGYEVEIIRGAENILVRHAPSLIVEAAPKHLHRAGTSLGNLHSSLLDHGYRAFSIGRLGLRLVDLGDDTAGNWIALPAPRSNHAQRVSRALKRCGLLPCVPVVNPLCQPR